MFSHSEEVILFRRFLQSWSIIASITKSMIVHCDSPTIAYMKDPKYHSKTKHINIKNNFVKDIIALK